MEHIGEVLGNLGREMNTQSQRIIEMEPGELSLEEKRERLRKSLGIACLDNTFENFLPAPGTEKALAAFKALAEGTTDKPFLLCYGGVGNGKTHLCEAAAIALYKRGLFCRVLTMDRMMSALKQTMDSGASISYEELLSNYCHADRLIIDDVEGTVFEFEQLEKIIRLRYRERLLTILTSNRDLTELPERVVSRFKDLDVGVVVLNQADDFRRLTRRERKSLGGLK